jgi:adenine-specific DNA-methyltransferase
VIWPRGDDVTELNFKGKEFVYNHHLAVPFRPLVPDAKKGIGPVTLDGNLIIHGDNLHALKALLPIYAGKVDCIFIDPPYNTGNEGWSYNDNVNSPMIKEWLSSNPIGIEDGLRHDKWCAMMWPRLRLLHELLAADGSIWITLDDNESHHARAMLDAIFGQTNFLANVEWVKRYTRSNNAKMFYSMRDHMLVYRKSDNLSLIKEPRSDDTDAGYRNPDRDNRGPWITSSYVNPAIREKRSNLCYPITRPANGKLVEHPTHAWKYSEDEHKRHVEEKRLWWGADGMAEYPRLKLFLGEAGAVVPVDIWNWDEVGSSDDGGAEIKAIFGSAVFDNPKPTKLIEKILSLVPKSNALVLDSFAGSGTTANAVLSANAKDNGSRRFILVEGEDYADKLTAERIRRVINGYDFKGTQKTELLRESLNWRVLQKADALVHRVEGIENLHGHEFQRIGKEVADGELIVTGERIITERAKGLGGAFTYCTLGEPVELDNVLTGEALPDFAAIGAALYHMATNHPIDPTSIDEVGFYLGESESQHVWLIYRADLEWLKSPDAALTLKRAKAFAESKPGKRHLVFAPSRFVSQKLLDEQNIPVEFVPLPFALYRIERT